MSEDPNVTKQQLHTWCMSLYEDGLERRRPHEAQWWENIATFCGDLWVEYDIHKRRLFEPEKEDHRVRLPINLAQPAVRTEYAKLLKNRPIVNAVARSADKADINAAEVSNKMVNNYGEKKFHKAKVRRRSLQWVLICGFGGIFVDYDETAGETIKVAVDFDGNPIFDANALAALKQDARSRKKAMKTKEISQGELVIKPVSPFQLVWDFSQIFIEDAAWVIYTDVYDVNEVYRRWNVEVAGSRDVEPGVIERRLIDRLDLSGKYNAKNGSTQELVSVHRMFIKPGHRYFKQGAEIVFTDDQIISKRPFPFSHGELPVSCMGHIFLPVVQYPMSVVQQVRPLVLELSKTESQMIENRNLVANPIWLEYRQSRINGEIINAPGARITADFIPGVPPPSPVQMPDLPSYVKDIPQILGEHILEVTGQNETSQGQVPPGARSGVAIAYLTEENDTKLGPTVQEFEEMIERATWQELQLYGQFYDAPRTIRIYRKHSEPEVFDFQGAMVNDHVVGVEVQAGSALPRSLAAKQQFTLDLYDRGLIRNPRQIMEMLEVGQGERDEWEVDMDQAERENRAMQEGNQRPVESWYNHQAHLYVHHQFMKSADFEELEPNIKQIFMEHEQEHQDELARMQRAQQPMPPGGGPAQVANGQNQPQGPTGPYASPDDIGAVAQNGSGNVQDYQPQ